MDEQNPLVVLKQLSDNSLPNYPKYQLLVYEHKLVFVSIPQKGHIGEKMVISYDDIKEVNSGYSLFGTGSLEITTYGKNIYKVSNVKEENISKARKFINKQIEPIQLRKKLNRLPLNYYFHHLTIHTNNLDESERFYYLLGFEKVFEYRAEDNSLIIRHLQNGYSIIEIIYKNPEHLKNQLETNGDIPIEGVKHFALKVPSVERAKEDLTKKRIDLFKEISENRIGIKHFFVKDPDGVLVEIVQDEEPSVISRGKGKPFDFLR